VTGHIDETGKGQGIGSTSNFPLPAATNDDDYLVALASACEDVVEFGPSLLVVSLGVDTYYLDPICDLALTADGFEACGAMVAGFGLPTVVLQEGGYADDDLGENVRRWLLGATGGVE
jgi:acetoin utilization deacetylase AcuC-like enzyme